ncbi:hypothetical protein D9611_001093 [Ephemerocybe angulata]|uniref:glutathione transferase n=1 Tax=Ephemerocybe angulata TaxID=980116 RepID=A0A8H5CHN2_9AGAR|nr:hypothetical protein D9611_001093 [Tulosesus angulatus]
MPRGLFEQAASIETSSFAVYAPGPHQAAYEDKPADLELLALLIASLEATMDVHDKRLSKQRYLAGDKVTLADLFHIVSAAALHGIGCDGMLTRPNVASFRQASDQRRATGREGFAALITSLKKTLDIYEVILAMLKYIAGDQLSLADLFHVPFAAILLGVGSNAMLEGTLQGATHSGDSSGERSAGENMDKVAE